MPLGLSMRDYTCLLLCMTNFFLFADQNLMAPNLTAIGDEFGFGPQERDEKLGGAVAFGFFVVGGPVALLVGYFTDTVNRCYLFSGVVAFGESACLMTYFVRTYRQLLFCRILTGVSIGGAIPVIFSMLGDMYDEHQRVYMATLLGIALSAGIAVGQQLAGVVGPIWGWRMPFLIIAIPAIALALLVLLTVDEPRRGNQEKAFREVANQSAMSNEFDGSKGSSSSSSQLAVEVLNGQQYNPLPLLDHSSGKGRDSSFSDELALSSDVAGDSEPLQRRISSNSSGDGGGIKNSSGGGVEYSEKIDCSKIGHLFRTPSVVLIFLQGMPGCLPWGMIYTFLNDYFSQERGMTVAQATAALTTFGIGGLFGQLLGGYWGQKLYDIDPRLQCLLMGSSTIIAVFPVLYLLNTSDVADATFYIVAVLAGFIVNMNGPNVKVVLTNVCIPEVRGSAFALYALTDDIGKGLGPALVVVFIHLCGGNRRLAFNFVVTFWLICGLLLLALSLTFVQDEQACQAAVKASLLRTNVDITGIDNYSNNSNSNGTNDVTAEDAESGGYSGPSGTVKVTPNAIRVVSSNSSNSSNNNSNSNNSNNNSSSNSSSSSTNNGRNTSNGSLEMSRSSGQYQSPSDSLRTLLL